MHRQIVDNTRRNRIFREFCVINCELVQSGKRKPDPVLAVIQRHINGQNQHDDNLCREIPQNESIPSVRQNEGIGYIEKDEEHALQYPINGKLYIAFLPVEPVVAGIINAQHSERCRQKSKPIRIYAENKLRDQHHRFKQAGK